MTHVVKIERPTNVQDASGGVVKTFSVVVNSTPASVQPMRFRERMQWAQRQIFITHKIYTPKDLGCLPGDRITVPKTGKTFVIIGFGDMAGRDYAFVIHAREQAHSSGSP